MHPSRIPHVFKTNTPCLVPLVEGKLQGGLAMKACQHRKNTRHPSGKKKCRIPIGLCVCVCALVNAPWHIGIRLIDRWIDRFQFKGDCRNP